MPIIIDTEEKDLDKQIEQANKTVLLSKQVDAKYFSDCFTGVATRQNGLFNKDKNTLDDFMKNARRLLGRVVIDQNKKTTIERYNNHIFGNSFNKTTKSKEKEFRHFESTLTTMIPPILIEQIIDNNEVALSFPKNTGMFNLNAMDSNWTSVSNGKIDGKDATTYSRTIIQSIDLYSRETITGGANGVVKSSMDISGQLDVYVIFATILDDMDKNGDIVFVNHTSHKYDNEVNERHGVASIVHLHERDNQSYDYARLNRELKKHNNRIIKNKQNTIPDIDNHHLQLLIGDNSITDILISQATTLTHQIDQTLIDFIKILSQRTHQLKKKQKRYPDIDKQLDNALIAFVQHIDVLNNLEDDLVSTTLLSELFETIKNNLNDDQNINQIARHSLRLLLSQRLHELDELRKADALYQFNPQNKTCTDAITKTKDFSVQQKRIITTTEPLVIGQAGAGSGKSHTLIGRINYLKDQGESLEQALVLSFTNVAAININNRFPGIRSETLANMFHTIYSATYPMQKLSQPSTVANAMRLLAPTSTYFTNQGIDPNVLADFIDEFAIRLEQFDQTGFKRVDLQQELKRTANLIENNLDMTILLLNAVEQTTLELEPIIIHHKLLRGGDDLNIPEDYQNLNYIMTDESQDISTFEYILLLELTLHYRSQLLIIGDGSQTLYEFRNSDPRYMNALEASDVFTSHKLETNYRSKEEILMYANQFLQIIDANKFAKIQLSSAKFSQPTEQSVKKAITIENNEFIGRSAKDYQDGLCEHIEKSQLFKKWFLDRVKKGEQIAMMGWTRKEVIDAGQILEQILKANNLGHIEVTNIMSETIRPMTLLSRFAREKQEVLRTLDPVNAHYLDEIERHVSHFVDTAFYKSSVSQNHFYNDFINKNVREIMTSMEWRAWLSDYRAGSVNKYQVGSKLLQELLRLETRKNAMDQYLRKQKEIPNYDNCPIIISTIHGTKGLEFDHTIVLYNEAKNGSTSQESLRMMFVALSRAKKSQFIINSHKPSAVRTITTTQAGMFETPINTAFLRTLEDAKRLTKNQGASELPPTQVGGF